jgi:hypothetical protein
MGLRSHDMTAIPLCREHHAALHDGREPFYGWGALKLRLWQESWARVLGHIYINTGAGSALETGDEF